MQSRRTVSGDSTSGRSCRLDADHCKHRSTRVGRPAGQLAQPRSQLLPPEAEQSDHEPPERRRFAVRRPAGSIERRQPQHRGVHLGARVERAGRHGEQPLRPRHRLHPDAERAVLRVSPARAVTRSATSFCTRNTIRAGRGGSSALSISGDVML